MPETDRAERASPGLRDLGPYRILDEIGGGAMGTVYRALHRGLDRQVALKVLRPEMLEDPDSVRRFLREARSSARLDHPHIVAVHDAGEIEDQYFIAMKLLQGRTLQQILAGEGRLDPRRARQLAMQLAAALDYAHGQDVIHLDVKPANVIVGAGDHATLTDFSIAQALNPGATRSATIAGTPLYMSPEQIQGKDVDSRSDIYSLGLLLYEMCVGYPPFQGQFVTVMYAHLHSPVPDLRAAAPTIPEGLMRAIYRALEKDRGRRYQTAGEMLRALERLEPATPVDLGGTVRMGRGEIDDLLSAQPDPQPEMTAAGVSGTAERTADRVPRTAAARGGAGRTLRLVLGAVVLCVAGTAAATLLRSTPTPVVRPHVAVPARAWVVVRAVRLSDLFARDPLSGQMRVGPPLTTISGRRLNSETIYAVASLGIHGRGAAGRTFTPSYVLLDPRGVRVATFPAHQSPIHLDALHPSSTFAIGFSLRPATRAQPPLGRYQVQLTIDGRPVQTLTFLLHA